MLYLASRSPRRSELLARLGVAFTVIDVDVPEVRAAGEAPADYVSRVAQAKSRAGLLAAAGDPDALVLAGDTEVVLGNRVFGKPADGAAAAEMLRALSGRTHTVVSVVSVAQRDRLRALACESAVTFAPLDAPTIARYVATGESLGKAGGYAIQGRAAAFITHLSGSYSGVMGLPLHETARLLGDFGVAV
ncbi:MAG TPA: Maf family nucleotide pyrophosphatase [Rhodanobacteraceae bacterium]|nr:Maf family nucleotide pyrophosphatase [Rhodanobacteraceae bacterium]